jgi:Zn-dependent protease with chaperone function
VSERKEKSYNEDIESAIWLSLERRRRTMMRALLISPLIVASLTLLGAGAGFYLAGLTGIPPAFAAVAFSTIGLFVSLPILVKMINRMIASEARE